MTTLVGTQGDFVKAIQELIELDYDAIEAYDAAINRVSNEDYKAKLKEFKEDHVRHTEELSELLKKHSEVPPQGPSSKQWLTKGKVVMANLMGDSAILVAMKSNEGDTNVAYDRVYNHKDRWEDSESILYQGLLDEKKHKEWLENPDAEWNASTSIS